MTRQYLKNAAFFYLAKYASSAENLRRVLLRKVDTRVRKARHDDPDCSFEADQYRSLVDETVALCLSSNLIDDQSYADMKANSLRSQGKSLRHIKQKLAIKGVDQETISQTLADYDGDAEAALRFAKRRKLGPYRLRERAENRMKDLAKMMRAGFSGTDARTIIDGDGEGDEN